MAEDKLGVPTINTEQQVAALKSQVEDMLIRRQQYVQEIARLDKQIQVLTSVKEKIGKEATSN